MDAEQIYEVITKLVGPIRPLGCGARDSERHENLKKFIKVFDKMHIEIDDIAYKYSDSYEASVKKAGDIASAHIDSMGAE